MKTLFTLLCSISILGLMPHPCNAQWISVYQNSNAEFYDADFPADQVGYVAASDTGGAMVLRTSNAGQTWTKKYIPGWSYIDKIVMLDSLRGYLIRGGVPGKLLKTTDGFNTFSVKNTDTSFSVQALSLLNDSTGYYLNNAARLRKFEHNGSGITHTIDSLVDGQNLQFVNGQTGYMDNGTRLLMSDNAGTNWNVKNSNLGFNSVVFKFTDSSTGYFSDGTMIYKTMDGGMTFPQQYNFPNTYSLIALNYLCMAANDTGNIAFSSNGGQNWQTELSGINVVSLAPHKVYSTPAGHYCYLFSQYSGEIRRREFLAENVLEIAADSKFVVWPNPAFSDITIKAAQRFDDASLNIYNTIGQLVKNFTHINGGKFILTREQLPAGLYYLQLREKEQTTQIQKILFAD